MSERDEAGFEHEQEIEAAEEAGAIGGRVSSDPLTEDELEMSDADRAVSEGGGGESEGFELAEAELEEHASHGDDHGAGRILEDAALLDEGETERGDEGGEADQEIPPDE
jgi:hypothetical protein